MDKPTISHMYYKYANLYYRFTEVEHFWSPAASQHLYTFRGTSYDALNGKLHVDNNAVVTLSEEDQEKKMEMITRETLMGFIGELV